MVNANNLTVQMEVTASVIYILEAYLKNSDSDINQQILTPDVLITKELNNYTLI